MAYRGGDHLEALMRAESRRTGTPRGRASGGARSYGLLMGGLLAVAAVVAGYMFVQSGALGESWEVLVIAGGVLLFAGLIWLALR